MTPKGPKNRFSVVPWRDSAMLNKVYKFLYNGNLSEKRWAIDEISVWDTRCHPSLPTAIESTVSLVRAIVQDILYITDKSFCREEDIRMLYCMALIRFVNLTLEHHQKGRKKIRLSYLATKLDIPSWLLDLRNEASHSFCPSLSMLRMGSNIALDYLEKSFWSEVVVNSKPKINFPSEREAEIVNLINQYKNVQFQRAESPQLKRSLSKDLKDILKKMGFNIFHVGGKFVDILVEPGNFIAAEDIKKLIPSAAPFIKDERNLTLPDNIQIFWTPLLRKIHNTDLMHMFLEKLLLAQEKCRIKVCHKIAIAWALQILAGVSSTSHLSDCFKKKKLLLNVPCLLYACLKGTTAYSMPVLSSLARQLDEKKDPEFLFTLITAYQGPCLSKEELSKKRKKDVGEEIIFSVEDVEAELKELRAKRMRPGEEVNIWSSPSVTMDFSDLPIGAVITPRRSDASEDEEALDDSWREQIKIEPTADDNFIIVNKEDGRIAEEMAHNINKSSTAIRPENFDMIYRRRPKQ